MSNSVSDYFIVVLNILPVMTNESRWLIIAFKVKAIQAVFYSLSSLLSLFEYWNFVTENAVCIIMFFPQTREVNNNFFPMFIFHRNICEWTPVQATDKPKL